MVFEKEIVSVEMFSCKALFLFSQRRSLATT
jgi:hypothetical protein